MRVLPSKGLKRIVGQEVETGQSMHALSAVASDCRTRSSCIICFPSLKTMRLGARRVTWQTRTPLHKYLNTQYRAKTTSFRRNAKTTFMAGIFLQTRAPRNAVKCFVLMFKTDIGRSMCKSQSQILRVFRNRRTYISISSLSHDVEILRMDEVRAMAAFNGGTPIL